MPTASLERRKVYALSLVALSAILYGFLGYLGTQLLHEHFSVSSMLFWRFFIATVWIFLFNLFQSSLGPTSKPSLGTLLTSFLLGALFYSSGAAFFFLACRETGTGLAMVIFFCYPLFVALLVWLQNRSNLDKFTLLSLVLILSGLILLKGRNENALSFIGIVFAIVSALCYAFYVFNSKKILTQLSATSCTTLVCLSCALVFSLLSVTTGSFIWPTTLSSLFYVLALGIIATALPIQLLLKGMQVIDPMQASILSVLEPIVTLAVGVAFLGELISPLQTLGILIILTGAFIAQFSRV
jgi:drug/metabolite transporter (DMT)-like permease